MKSNNYQSFRWINKRLLCLKMEIYTWGTCSLGRWAERWHINLIRKMYQWIAAEKSVFGFKIYKIYYMLQQIPGCKEMWLESLKRDFLSGDNRNTPMDICHVFTHFFMTKFRWAKRIRIFSLGFLFRCFEVIVLHRQYLDWTYPRLKIMTLQFDCGKGIPS